jgi:hypothetical protein
VRAGSTSTKLRSLLLGAAVCSLCSAVAAETVIVQVLEGKSGKPVPRGKTVHVIFFVAPIRHLLSLHTDENGKVEFETEGATDFKVSPVGYIPCGEPSGETMKDYSVAEIADEGVVTANNCGNAVSDPVPGRLIYYVKPGRLDPLKKYPD